MHPDGTRCVVSVTRPDFAADAYVGQLWSVPLDGAGKPRRITLGFADSQPQFSPDGTVLGFLRRRPGSPPQLYAVSAAGGEPVQLTEQKLGVGWFGFSPDSAQVLFTARVPQQGRYGTVDGVGPGAEDPRLISSYQYRANGAGYTADKRVQVFLLELPALDAEPWIEPAGRARDAAGKSKAASPDDDDPAAGRFPQARQLTDADADHQTPVFTPDGRRILFTAALHPEADNNLVSDVYLLEPAAVSNSSAVSTASAVPDSSAGSDSSAAKPATPVRLTNRGSGPLLGASSPTPSADGKWLYFLGHELSASGIDFVARNTALYVLPMDAADNPGPAGVPRRLTDPEDTDLTEPGIVAAGGSRVLVFNRTRGAVELLELDAEGSRKVLLDGPRVVSGAAEAAGAVVVSFADPQTMGDVAVLEPAGLRTLTDFSTPLRAGTRVAVPVEATYASADGYPVHGWMFLPEGPGPHPVLLNIHGGPFSQFDWGYFDEAQAYAAAGYAVLQCNPRGSAGYGQEHGAVIREAMGTKDLDDVLAFLDGALAAHPELDRERLGVMGGSYGGYLSAWAIANDHRFTAAIVERGFLDPLSFIGSSDIGWFFSAAYTGTDPQHVLAQSPMARVGEVRTPALVIHSEEDLRCPLEQAQRYYTALKHHGVPTEMLLFPGENHELSRAGTPWHRMQRFEHILRWWGRWLPTPLNPAVGVAAESTLESAGAV
ncbi:prolyl oligopeptidase family serine peptidase [Arthrobacter jiangjiafuii]|nr:prolyl oligopeptidase family serine peptidase [Arthrobacter jiangjiafuii]